MLKESPATRWDPARRVWVIDLAAGEVETALVQVEDRQTLHGRDARRHGLRGAFAPNAAASASTFWYVPSRRT